MKKTIIRIVIGLVLLLLLAFFVIPCLPMGEGSAHYARKWTERLDPIESPADARAQFGNVAVLELTNGEWVVWVSANSHGNPWGGTVVTKDCRGDTRSFYGHVCGGAHLHGETIDEVYTSLLAYYGTSGADYRQKEVARRQERERKEAERVALESRVRTHLLNAGITVRRLAVDLEGKCTLDVSNSAIVDLDVLSNLPVTELDISETAVSNLSPLAGMQLTRLRAYGCSTISCLSPLKGMPLEVIEIGKTAVDDLSPLTGMQLRWVYVQKTRVIDISPLKGMPITRIILDDCAISDLAPLQGMPIEHINCIRTPVSDISALAGMPIEWLRFEHSQVTNISALQGMPLKWIHLESNPIRDIAPLRGVGPLDSLGLSDTLITDLSPLRGVSIDGYFNLERTPVKDISPLADCGITSVYLGGTEVRDLSPLAALHLEWLTFDPNIVTQGLPEIRAMTSLKEVGVDLDHRIPAEDFWIAYNAGEFQRQGSRTKP